MAIVYDPITQRNVQVADPPLPAAPPPAVEHVFLPSSPPPALPYVPPEAIVTTPAPMAEQGSSAAAPAAETDLPDAPPVVNPLLGATVDSVV